MTIHISQPSLQSLYVDILARGQKLSCATAFVAKSATGASFLVTNRHVVTGRHQITGLPLDTATAAIPDELVVWHNSKAGLGQYVRVRMPLSVNGFAPWIEHPTLGAAADFVAFPITELPDVALYPYSTQYFVHQRMQPAQRVNVVGFPFGIRTGGSFPVWATGFVASEPEIDHGGHPVFLIDCRTRKGQSGSPVIFHHSTGGVLPDETDIQATTSASWLLGIYSGRIDEKSDLGIVWKTHAIAGLLDHASASRPPITATD